MNDPERLMHHGASSFESRLLQAGRGDAVSEKSRRAIVSGLGVGGVMFWASGVAAAVRKAGNAWVKASALRWAGVAALSGAALWAGVKLTQPSAPAGSTSKIVTTTTPTPALTPKLDEAPAPPPEQAKPADEKTVPGLAPRARSSRAPNPASDKVTLADELAMVDLARAALARKDAVQSLRLLDEYARRFSPRRLDAEATVLRIEALSGTGDRATASRLGQAFLSRHPQGPYARRVRSLIGASE